MDPFEELRGGGYPACLTHRMHSHGLPQSEWVGGELASHGGSATHTYTLSTAAAPTTASLGCQQHLAGAHLQHRARALPRPPSASRLALPPWRNGQLATGARQSG